TDATRPSFAQKGNSYMALRDIVPTAQNNFGESNQFQYFGLATPFQEVALTSQVTYDGFEGLRVTTQGEFVINVAYDSDRLESKSVNNRSGDGTGNFDGGNKGFYVGTTVGTPTMDERWDWAINVGYKYLESDAVIDAFTDSDFGLGGTN